MNSDLESAIEKLIEKVSLSDLSKARDSLTLKYRNPQRFGKKENLMTSDLERLSYLVTRMPATYSVIQHVLAQVNLILPNLNITNMLDLGSGPGTAFFAALNTLEGLQKAHLIEKDLGLIRLGKQLQEVTLNTCQVEWQEGDITHLSNLKQYDLVTLSYAMNELETSDQQAIIEKAFAAANKVLIIIEPGTMDGFRLIRDARAHLINLGGSVVAPCPHNMKCPMPENDWCHFSERVSRTSYHRQLKGGTLGHEDEKFSYVAVCKSSLHLEGSRIIRHPEKHSGHLSLNLCTKDGLINKTVSKKDGEIYKQAKKLDWGDLF